MNPEGAGSPHERPTIMTPVAVKERIIHIGLAAVAGMSLVLLLLIVFFLVHEGVGLFSHVSLGGFVFGMDWYPTEDPPVFGILPMLAASFAITVYATLIAVPLGLFTAIYLTEIAPAGVRRIIKPAIELLAAFPSVVIGFFGMVVVAPFLQKTFGLAVGLNMTNAALMLAVMSVPTICSIAEDALYSVPRTLREASLALGATRWETIRHVTVPAAFSGLATAVMLGMSRCIGETMVVLMVAGGAGIIPTSIFDPVRPMTATMAAEIGEAPFRGEHYQALFCIGLFLFIFTFIFNQIAFTLSEKRKQEYKG